MRKLVLHTSPKPGGKVPRRLELSFATREATYEGRRGGDVFQTHTNACGLSFLLADMSSSGIGARELAEQLRWAFLRQAPHGVPPREIIDELNRLLISESLLRGSWTFATAFVGAIATEPAALTYASAGHDIALRFRSRRHDHLAATGPLIGVDPGAHYRQRVVDLAPGDTLAVATNGVTLARRLGVHEEIFGTSGIAGAFKGDAQRKGTAAEHVLQHCDQFCSELYHDDASLLVLHDNERSRRFANKRLPIGMAHFG